MALLTGVVLMSVSYTHLDVYKSQEYILVQNSNINCNDDNFCLKAGRDSDGLRVNRPCRYVVIRDCIAGHGDGLFTCGSETSGGINNIVAYNMTGMGTKYGLRFKSTCQRGGVIEDSYLCNREMIGVRDPVVVDLNWHPAYSTSKLPEGYEMCIRDSYNIMGQEMTSPTGFRIERRFYDDGSIETIKTYK